MAGSSTADGRPLFYYDVGSPWCWLAAERAHEVLGTVPVWQPVRAEALEPVDRGAVERRAIAQGIPEVRWPEPWPFDSELAMLVATFAKQTGRAVAFSLAAMRQAFAAGAELRGPAHGLRAGAAWPRQARRAGRPVEARGGGEAPAAAGARPRGARAVG